MKVEVIDINGKGTGRKVELSDSIFGIEPNEHAIYLDVKQYLAHQRQGTHKAKERGEIVGSTRKIKKQKGTGTARAGSIKSPIFRGGGRIFGPRPRSYSHKLNKNVKRLARKSALSLKSKGNEIKVIENFNFDAPKTKSFVALLGALGLSDSKSLFVVSSVDQNVYLSARNVQSSNVITSSNVNTYKILDANTLVIAESALEGLESTLNKQ
ncbi:MAG: 50S ribosomal protein L4 [Flavobacteriaceae bacterium TMED265]|nr:MAG: 50S ribosomal protein L4 [Flavobacteriaceae bacterium TMED265]